MLLNLFLLSSSRYGAAGFLLDAKPAIFDFLSDVSGEVIFIPYANVAQDYDDYEARVVAALECPSLKIRSIHHAVDPVAAIENAQAIAVGGGNTFALLARMQQAKIMEPIRQAVNLGKPYLGWSAGSNLACPTICTTNEMPICQPENFDALGLIPFQINPHFVCGQIDGQNGESREQRLTEFLAFQPKKKVLALPEGTSLIQQGGALILKGQVDGILFSEQEQQAIIRGEDLSWMWANAQYT